MAPEVDWPLAEPAPLQVGSRSGRRGSGRGPLLLLSPGPSNSRASVLEESLVTPSGSTVPGGQSCSVDK